MNIILDAKSKTYKESIHKVEEKSNERTFGFAVKLTVLEKNNISISRILNELDCHVIIDAEYERLDRWLDQQINSGAILKKDLSRILITVQAKRFDAEEQLKYLEQKGVGVVLVSGHRDYLNDNEIKQSGIKLLAKYYQQFSNIRYLGISSKMYKTLLDFLEITINDDIILELYGEHGLMKSSLWAYWADYTLSDEAKRYIHRRHKLNGNLSFIEIKGLYLLQSINQLMLHKEVRSVFVYVDIIDKEKYFENMKVILESS